MSARNRLNDSKKLPKRNIIKSRLQIKEVMKSGSKRSGELLTIYQLHEPRAKESRFAFLCDKEINKATERNRLKRIVREIVRSEKDKLPKGALVYFVKPAGRRKTFWQIREELLALISK